MSASRKRGKIGRAHSDSVFDLTLALRLR